MRWEMDKEFVVEDLSEKDCPTLEDTLNLWTLGKKNRVVTGNRMHEYSSRSHSIFILNIEDVDH